jgi:hypothetical protein
LDGLDVTDKEKRSSAISAFEARNEAEKFGWAEINTAFPELANRYAEIIEDVRQKIQEADLLASDIRDRVRQRLG